MVDLMMSRSYSELITLSTYEDRFNYLKLNGRVGKDTFGYDRYIYQNFLKSDIWLRFRDSIIIRDNGCDLGIPGREIYGPIEVHHINPVTLEDILNMSPKVLDPDNAVCTSGMTHKAIHYGSENSIIKDPVQRTRNDTCPWKT